MPAEEMQPVQPQYVNQMNVFAKTLDDLFNGDAGPKKVAFALFIFPFGDPEGEKRANYVSNAPREDMVAAMREWIARSEARFQEQQSGPRGTPRSC